MLSSTLVVTSIVSTMILQVFLFLFSSVLSTPWGREHVCPAACTCREEHFSDLAIARYARQPNHHVESLATDYQVSNNVLYDDDIKFEEENPLLRVATCFIQAETDIEEFILTIPKSIQALSFIQSSNSGNKTLRTNYLNYFDELIALEVQGSDQVITKSINNDFVVEIDDAVLSLKYLNFDQTRIKNTKLREIKVQIEEENDEIEIKFDSVTMIQKKDSENEILPYYKYKEIQRNLESPVLTEFSNLILIRIHGCNLQNIHWEMFDGLQNLKYLLLENNNFKFIPNFAFYGTPNLKTLSLALNNLLNIQITDLAGLLELEYLDLSHNNFSQLSELSFPPFPKLKVADFRDNPITTVFPNTFDIMNTTDSIIIGSEEIRLNLLPNSFLGLNKLIKLTIHNVDVPILSQEMLTGMPILKELILTGNINKLEFDAFIEVRKLEKLILSNCSIYNISMDAFYGLDNLLILDLSINRLRYLPPNIFDEQTKLKELILNGNEFSELPKGIFNNIPAKLIRLNENPWHCSCAMSDWDPMVINKVKQKMFTSCDSQHDKGISCVTNKKYAYSYENRMAPKCNTPKKVKDLSIFQAIRRHLQCKNHKLKLKIQKTSVSVTTDKNKIYKHNVEIKKPNKNMILNQEFNDLKNIHIKDNSDSNHLFVNLKFDNNPPEFDNYKLRNNQPDFGFYFHDGLKVNNEEEKQSKHMHKKKKHLQKIKKLKKDKDFDIQHKEM